MAQAGHLSRACACVLDFITMPPRTLPCCLCALLAQILFSASSIAQSCPRTFGPMGPEFRTSQTIYYDQIWSQAARGPSGWTFAWSESQDVFARRFDLGLNPLGVQFRVDGTYNLGIQDEPAIGCGSTGNLLIAWSERNGYDGSLMGIYGRVYDSNGNPLATEFPINSITYASQWRPLIAPTPTGGWVVAWSGDFDGNAYFKVLSSTGASLTGDVMANTFTYDAQVDTAVAVNPSGTIFIAFIDFSGHGNVGTGLNLFGRTFDSAGNPIQAQEFALTSFTSNGDQRDPRAAADGLGRFFVVWESQFGDGSRYGIFARVFDAAGAPLAPEFQVNTTTADDQREARIAVDQLGRSLIAWQDFSAGTGSARIRARRFNGQANPLGPDFVVNENPATAVSLPSVAMDTSGSDMMIGFQGPGVLGNGLDVYAKRFASNPGPQIYCTGKVNSQGCTPAIGYTGSPSASSSNPFLITGTNLLNHKPAILIYGYASSFVPFQGVTICIAPPLKRLPFQDTGGNPGPNDCSGAPSTDFNLRIQSGIDPGLVSGATVSARWYYRDAQDPTGYGTGFTNAIRFVICP